MSSLRGGAAARLDFELLPFGKEAARPGTPDEHDFPRSGPAVDQFLFLLRYAVLAPSSHNSQPWRARVSDSGIAVYADYTRRLPVADPGDRELVMSVGAFLMNLRVAAARFGVACRVEEHYGGEKDRPVAFASLTPCAPPEKLAAPLGALFPAVVRRHTNRSPFLATGVPGAVLEELRGIGRASTVSLFLSSDGSLNAEIAALVAEADRMRYADPAFRSELGGWIRPSGSRNRDGIPRAAFGMGGV
ncbi:MAG: hypothetical protein WB626_02765, partial [Bacteroidota bacterium]